MNKPRILELKEIKETVVGSKRKDAELLRRELVGKGTFFVNVMSSPGSGKTTFLESVIKELDGKYSVAVLEADIDGDVDAKRISELGAEAVQLHTGGMCHMDSEMSREGLSGLKSSPEIVFLENVGNLVCPAEFDTGSHLDVVLLSVPEGDDKPLKYTLMFGTADMVVVTKTDTMSYFDFDKALFEERVRRINPSAPIFYLSAKTGEGVSSAVGRIISEMKEKMSL